MESNFQSFAKLMMHPVKFRIFMFAKLPSAFFSGVRIRSIVEDKCEVSVPFKWFSQNPFKSTYFACLSMAAEMSTGALAMAHMYKSDPPVSMLVIKTEAEYFKKATNRSIFTCEDGALIKRMIEECISRDEPRSITAKSIGRNEQGDIVAEFKVTWSFKARSKK